MAGLFHELPVFGQSAQGLQIAWSELAALAGKMLGHGGEIRIFLRTQGNVQPVGQMDEIAQTGVPAACAGRAPRGMVVEDQGMDGLRQSRCFAEGPARTGVGALVDFKNQIPGFRFQGHGADIVEDGRGQQLAAPASAVAQFFRHAQAQIGHARVMSGQSRRHHVQRGGKASEQIKKTDRPHKASRCCPHRKNILKG